MIKIYAHREREKMRKDSNKVREEENVIEGAVIGKRGKEREETILPLKAAHFTI